MERSKQKKVGLKPNVYLWIWSNQTPELVPVQCKFIWSNILDSVVKPHLPVQYM